MNAETYEVEADGVKVRVEIKRVPNEFVPVYEVKIPEFGQATHEFMGVMKNQLLKQVPVTGKEVLDPRNLDILKQRFFKASVDLVKEKFPGSSEDEKKAIAGRMVQEMLGLDKLEFLLKDDNLEEICLNTAEEPAWVYHKKYGWLKTNIFVEREATIQNYSSAIGRHVGRQINTQNPLLDAYLSTGDRVNATLFPVSIAGNTITIRKFARKPWTITDLIANKTINVEVAALLWLAMQYELNVLISGGTGGGKTSFLNVLSAFIPPNQRVISIEQTREITLPKYLQWVPLVVREPTNEGKGGISMLDLMVNSLRMRPDRIIVGEVRRAEEAEVLFEAMHTGHSVYATLHAETVDETLRRLNNPPISMPAVMLESLHLVVAMYRDKKSGIRRVYELGEILPAGEMEKVKANLLYRWRPLNDLIEKENPSYRLLESLVKSTRMTEEELNVDIQGKTRVLNWLVEKKINTVDEVGKVIAEYYSDEKALQQRMRGKQ
ncbi:MAG: type II/IV secretion system ATPase subunit [Candidatus Micrarchaeota archaeon]